MGAPLHASTVRAIRRRYERGEHVRRIARSLGLALSSVMRHTRDLPRRAKAKLRPEEVGFIVHRLAEGASVGRVAREIGRCESAVRSVRDSYARPMQRRHDAPVAYEVTQTREERLALLRDAYPGRDFSNQSDEYLAGAVDAATAQMQTRNA